MNVFQAVVLGIIQGLTEFLPVSSSGHLLLGSIVLGFPVPGLSLSLLLHLGTAFATVVMLWEEIAHLARGIFTPGSREERLRAVTLVGFIAAASVPGAAVGLTLGDFLDTAFGSGGVAALGLVITGFILMLTERAGFTGFPGAPGKPPRAGGSETAVAADRGVRRRTPRKGLKERPEGDGEILSTVNLRRALLVGLFQAVAVIPGISRSGATIASGILSGMEREDAARFSFLLALPAILGGALLDFREALSVGEQVLSFSGLLGATVAFATGVVALSVVFRTVRKGSLRKFAYYCFAAGAISLIYLMARP
ncbi:MAG TPA: undecaprenyl-diphosphate phosphatase [Firmicutes bacterium]|nr:undecaprenyl-diphosphate phosphatase [Candidatus Fermentithermobacillaceae bacterium]